MGFRFFTKLLLSIAIVAYNPGCFAEDVDEQVKLTEWKHLTEQAIQYYYGRYYNKSESTLIKALSEIRKVKKNSNEEIATLARLVDVCLKRGNCLKAERYFDTLIKLYNLKAGNKTINKEAISEIDSLSYTFGSFDTTDPALKEKYLLYDLKLKDWVSGDNHRNISEALRKLVVFYLSQGRYAKAEPYAIRLVKCDQKSKGFEATEVAQELNTLALIKYNLNKYLEAESYFRQSLAILTSLEKTIPTYIPTVKAQLAENLLKLKEYRLARKESLEALDMLERDVGSNDIATITVRRALADSDEHLGNLESSIKQREIAIALTNRYYGINNPLNLKDLKILKDYYTKNKKHAKAQKIKNELEVIEEIVRRNKVAK